MTVNNTLRGPVLGTEETITTTSRRGPQGQPIKTTQRSTTVPAQSREFRNEKKYSSNTNRRNAPPKVTKTTTTTRTTTTRSSSRPSENRVSTTTTRGQSAGGIRRRY